MLVPFRRLISPADVIPEPRRSTTRTGRRPRYAALMRIHDHLALYEQSPTSVTGGHFFISALGSASSGSSYSMSVISLPLLFLFLICASCLCLCSYDVAFPPTPVLTQSKQMIHAIVKGTRVSSWAAPQRVTVCTGLIQCVPTRSKVPRTAKITLNFFCIKGLLFRDYNRSFRVGIQCTTGWCSQKIAVESVFGPVIRTFC